MGATEEKLKENAENLTLQTEDAVMDTIEEILSLYVLCINDMEKNLRSFVSTYSREVNINNKVKTKNVLAYSETKRRLTDAERKVFNTQLKDWYATVKEYGMDKSYQEYLQALGKKKYITRMEYLQAYLRHDIELLFYKMENKLYDKFSDVYTYSYYTSNYNLLQTLGIPGTMLELDESDIDNAINGKYANTSFKLSLKGNKVKLIDELETSIPQGFARGFNINKLEDIVNAKTANSRNRSIALTRTETDYLCNKANLAQYKEFGVEKYEYLATLDMRTSDMCRDMDGYIGLVSQAEQGVNFPPLHVNCRSTTVPYIENLQNFGDRVAKTAKGKTFTVSRRLSQEDYIKRYVPKKYQAKLLQFKNSYRPKIERK